MTFRCTLLFIGATAASPLTFGCEAAGGPDADVGTSQAELESSRDADDFAVPATDVPEYSFGLPPLELRKLALSGRKICGEGPTNNSDLPDALVDDRASAVNSLLHDILVGEQVYPADVERMMIVIGRLGGVEALQAASTVFRHAAKIAARTTSHLSAPPGEEASLAQFRDAQASYIEQTAVMLLARIDTAPANDRLLKLMNSEEAHVMTRVGAAAVLSRRDEGQFTHAIEKAVADDPTGAFEANLGGI